VSLDNTILNVALPVIVRTLHASSSSLQWIVDSYAIVFAGLLLVAGSLGDRVGRKWVFMAGLVIFSAGSAVSAFSGSADRLIAARAFMGVGGAAIMPSTLSILTSTFTEARERARAIGIWSGTTGLGVASARAPHRMMPLANPRSPSRTTADAAIRSDQTPNRAGPSS